MMRKGLTLMELLVVISILATLAALLFPFYLNLRTRTDITVCANQLRQIGLALKMYAKDYGDETPYGMPFLVATLYPHYIRNKDIFVYPTFRKVAENDLEKVHTLVSSRLDVPLWCSYWQWFPQALDRFYSEGRTWISYAEVYAKRGDDIPVLMCTTHRMGCPRSNFSVFVFFPELKLRCYNLANPSAPILILRWNGSVNAVHGQLSDAKVILLHY